MSAGIGTLAEKSLHAALKQWYAQPGDQFEVRVGRRVVDIVRDALLIEIQTGNFGAIRRKLAALTAEHPVRLVHPIAARRFVVRLDADGREATRRKSPKRGTIYDLFAELVRCPALPLLPNFTLEVLLVQEEVLLRDDGAGSWRRKGWSVADRRLIGVDARHVFAVPGDYTALLPPDLPDVFGTFDVAEGLKLPRRTAQQMVYCLRAMGALTLTGKDGKALLYRRTPPNASAE